MTEIYNARIESTSFMIEDHGYLTAFVHLRFGEDESSGQGFGGHTFMNVMQKDFSENNHNFVGRYLVGVLQAVGVEKWEDLKGKYCRIEVDRLGGPINAIGHVTYNKWFRPGKLIAECF